MLLLPVITTLLLTLTHTAVAQAERWQRPLGGLSIVREFDFDERAPFVRGAHRGVRLAGHPGELVRAPCAGRVTFAGRHPRLGPGVSLRCGRVVATEFGLERLTVRRGTAVTTGTPVGLLGARGALYLGARVAVRRWGYRDPLALLGGAGGASPLGPAPLPGRRTPPAHRWTPRPQTFRAPRPIEPQARSAPLAAWLGVSLAGAAAGLGVTLRRRTRSPRRQRLLRAADRP